jgi:hypothetical protein
MSESETERPEEREPTPAPGEEEDLEEFDYLDPLKRDPDGGDALPGLDPIVPPVPPES